MSSVGYTITFPKNPNRRHSRGVRTVCPSRLGLEAVSDLQSEFEEASEAAESAYKLKHAHVVSGRTKQKAAADKAFKLRGFKGKRSVNKAVDVDGRVGRGAVSMMSHKDYEAFKVSKARRTRLETGSEIHSKKEKRVFGKMGKASVRPTMPWEKTTKVVVAGSSSASAARLNLFSIVALFKRTGKLPIYSAASIKALPSVNVDGKALRRMIEQLLVRGGGVELNPGPVCANAGKFVRGIVIGRKGGVVRCMACSAPLTMPKDGTMRKGFGLHPEAVVERDDGCDAFVLPEVPHVFTKEEKREVRFACPAKRVPLTGPAPIGVVPVQASSPRPVEAPVEPPAPSPSPVVKQEQKQIAEVVTLANKPKIHDLKGFKLDDEDALAIVQDLVPCSVFERILITIHLSILTNFFCKLSLDQVRVTEHRIAYDGERRLAACRGVPEIKASFDLVNLSANVPVWNSYILLLYVLILSVLLISSIFLPEILTTLLSFPAGIAGIYVRALYRRSFYMMPINVCYAPHLVSCLISEFDRGTSRDVVRSTIRMKFRRFSAFPVPDVDAVAIMEGTERVVMSALAEQHFFSHPPACIAASS